jgi:hypothetical protein
MSQNLQFHPEALDINVNFNYLPFYNCVRNLFLLESFINSDYLVIQKRKVEVSIIWNKITNI